MTRIALSAAFVIAGLTSGWALVGGLLVDGRPSAVAGLIVSVVIDTVDAQSRGAAAHVGDKAFEAASLTVAGPPAVANGDAAPTIIGEVPNIRIVAPTDHGLPHSVLVLAGLAVFAKTQARCLGIETPAGGCPARDQMRRVGVDILSAVALASPAYYEAAGGESNPEIGNRGEATEFLCSKIAKVGHGGV